MPDLPPRFLLGGGRNEDALRPLYAQFLAACPTVRPVIGCFIVDEGDGEEIFDRFADGLTRAAPCRPYPLLVPLYGSWDPAALAGMDGLFVGAGLTPAYRDALAPAAHAVREWMVEGERPYAGFSAGAAVAAGLALVGGYRIGERAVCHEDAAEDLDAVTVRDGLGLVPFTVDVHCAQWGTLPRLVAAVESGLVEKGVGLDEHTMLGVRGEFATVSGAGRAWVVTRREGEVRVQSIAPAQSGTRFC